MNQSQPPSAGPFSGVPWSLVLGLGALALIRPLLGVTGVAEAIDWRPYLPLGMTVVITVAWVAAVVVARVPRPLLTLVYAGLAHAVFSTVLGAVLSPIVRGGPRGPLTDPLALVSALAANALWGLLAGAVAVAVRAALEDRRRGP
ncbi:hypothetical protein [Nocardiopsis tropica]|uniref:Uncharacterized protein n=1 Tax=Nocardiopsis tropica TaxID=109330 RepID=A0ABU7KZ10_9ACTN|nr:hypothetical protein [Nocardiopsis umidischolae]MEE2054538.1 hypothetical protein [Nocardiopsis umidischolae]